MKFNWGTGITIGIILFMSFILFMVFKATQTESDLNAENYYEQEMAYQDRIDAIANAAPYKKDISIEQVDNGLQVNYPSEMLKEGKVHLFRPDNASLDVEMPMTSAGSVLIPRDKMILGVYQVQMSWTKGGDDYYYEENVTIR